MATLPDRALVVVDAPVADLRGWDRNPRRVKPARLEQLKRMLAEAPEMLRARPLIALLDGTVIAGNQRLAAAAELGWDSIPTVYADLDEATAIEWAFRDNNSVGESDDDLAAELLSELSERGRVLDMTGFAPVEVSALLRRVAPPVDPDAVPALPPVPRSVRGEVYELGPHRLMCGDSTDGDQVGRLLAGALVEMVFTDPPYGVAYDGGSKVREEMAGDDSTDLYEPCCRMAARFSTTDAPLYLWHAGVKGIAAAAAAAAAGYEIRCEIVWNKNQAQFGSLSAQYKQKHEPAYYCFKRGQIVNWAGPTNEVTVWDVDRSASNEFHPTQKPVALAQRALANHLAPSVLDLFGGSGSTLIAAEIEGRSCYAMEIEPAYCDVIRQRYADYVQDQRWAP